ncbi:hypothetical protein B5M42_011250 [Paenibacillus athensensis]|uniref:Uncharacterized protein n=1 Tax=Paenibacillus athensensis TaxID=1967502 RepID=A0A4Y8PVP7_9BACL|nr:hypothetical protein [Paenibacillus athensensis]MCD1259410.1 hypothetical protein [Paenibacillus athensensis]
MSNPLAITGGTETVSVELTVKEALALGAGVKFSRQPALSAEAKRKVLRTLERKLLPHAAQTIPYEALEV